MTSKEEIKQYKQDHKQCIKCKVILSVEMFKINSKNEYTKNCIKCLEKDREYRKTLRCKHGKNKSVCRECGGSSICEHDKIRTTCKECKGGAICEHNKERSKCKECKGGGICIHQKIKSKCKEC